jgi:hypothetical protein
MGSISQLQFGDEPDFRVALAQNGITGAAADHLVSDEAANRQMLEAQRSRSQQIWSTVQSFVLLELAGPTPQAAELPSLEVVSALSRLVIAAEYYTAGQLRHPALRQIATAEPEQRFGGWSEAVANSVRQDAMLRQIRVEPHESGLVLEVSYSSKARAGISTATIPTIGNDILPRTWLSGLALEALHRLSGTRRRFDRPASAVQGLTFGGSGARWSQLLDPLLDFTGSSSVTGELLEPEGEKPLIIRPPADLGV